jgi:hypothetical protein
LENEDGSSLILDSWFIEVGTSCSDFSINANLFGSESRYPNSFRRHLPYEIVVKTIPE